MIALAEAFEDLLAVLDRLEIRFLVGGSVASSTHGIARQTNDIDLVAELAPDRVEEFCDALAPGFYVDSDDVTSAVGAGRAFHAIHLKSAYKFDIFPAAGDPFALSELQRRRYTTTSITGLERIEFPVASPEDTIVAKLSWFRKGGGTSDRQWHDILGVMSSQAGRLDLKYLRHWADELGVTDLLSKAFAEVQARREGIS